MRRAHYGEYHGNVMRMGWVLICGEIGREEGSLEYQRIILPILSYKHSVYPHIA